MKKVIAFAIVVITASTVYAYLQIEYVGSFGISRSLQYGEVQRFEDGDVTCYVATSRKGVSISCVR